MQCCLKLSSCTWSTICIWWSKNGWLLAIKVWCCWWTKIKLNHSCNLANQYSTRAYKHPESLFAATIAFTYLICSWNQPSQFSANLARFMQLLITSSQLTQLFTSYPTCRLFVTQQTHYYLFCQCTELAVSYTWDIIDWSACLTLASCGKYRYN